MPKTSSIGNITVLKQRAQLYQTLRSFFLARQVLEVETPILGQAATVDPFIDSLITEVMGEARYLQTSPEFFLKRLLCAGSGDIYSLGKAFRQGEKGARHQPEFTLLEWYRLSWDEHQLMDEVTALIKTCLPDLTVTKCEYRELFIESLDIDPHRVTVDALKALGQEKIDSSINSLDKNTWLDLLMTHIIEPKLPQGLVLIYDYPATQAALAQLGTNKQGQTIARRFEAYVDGIELANGYFELADADEQRARFEKDQDYRRINNLPVLPYDKQLVDALKQGMPSCAGVALGVDRLLMLMCGESSINQVMSFCE